MREEGLKGMQGRETEGMSGAASPSLSTSRRRRDATRSAKARKLREKGNVRVRETGRRDGGSSARFVVNRSSESQMRMKDGKREEWGCYCLPLIRPGAGFYIHESETVSDKYSTRNDSELEGGKVKRRTRKRCCWRQTHTAT